VPTGFELTKGHYVSNAQATAADKAFKIDYNALGRIRGYEAIYDKSGIVGMLEIVSRASVYRNSSGAHRAFLTVTGAALRSTSPRFRRLAVGVPLGVEARFYRTTTTQNGTEVDAFVVYWRTGQFTAATITAGISGTVDPADVVAIAKKQQRRIAAVA
jgi:hypothetical protein